MSNGGTDQEGGDGGGINITFGKLIAYPVGLLLILSGLGALISNVVAGVLILLAGIIALPYVRAKLKQSKGIGINRWATLALVLVLVIGGGALLGPTSGGDTQVGGGDGGQSSQQTDLVSESDNLVPTIDDFGSGWQGGEEGNNTATYLNVETDTVVRYNVTVYESVSEAQTAMEERRPENVGTDSISAGDSGYIYAVSDRGYRSQVRVANAVCFTGYNGGVAVATPETNAIDFAERCANAISG
jgi:hypothetical protein